MHFDFSKHYILARIAWFYGYTFGTLVVLECILFWNNRKIMAPSKTK